MTDLRQTTDRVLMVRPAAFGFNAQTAATNRLQRTGPLTAPQAAALAREEFDRMVRALQSEGIRVCVAEDTPEPPKPDAVFPNNWVSFHGDGTLVLYPLCSVNRRPERRDAVISAVLRHFGATIRRTLDLTHHEQQGRYLEGTGSLVLDHRERVAYACRSARTDAGLVEEWSRELGYEPLVFDAVDPAGNAYYHTNVMLSIGSASVILSSAAIATADRARVLGRLAASDREIIDLAPSAIADFAGNLLELASWDEALGDCRVLVMSARAREALDGPTFARLAACVDNVLAIPVPTIEQLGGGGVRCMLAEVFLP